MKEELIDSGKEKIKSFVNTYLSVQKDENIRNGIKKLQSASKEFDSAQFMVLVVGAVKSGKSTLVNLFAREYVSPTHFLECTVRPSAISKGTENKIFQYTLKPGKDKIEAFTSILDYIRGIRNRNETEQYADHMSYPLNRLNLDLYVRLNMNEENIRIDNTLITNITTKGGNLINGETILIDMPGLDGGYANFDDPVYKEIVEHADFILFIQSSNSAVNKISKEFLNLLIEKNREVPVALIHNVFDASYWKTDEDKEQQTEEQINFAVKTIKERKFDLIEAYSINLGKVTDAAFYPDIRDLQKEKDKFLNMEEKLLQTIKEKRKLIHERNCIFKVIYAVDNLLTKSGERRKIISGEKDKLEWINNKLDEFIKRFRAIEVKKDEIERSIRNMFENKRHDWEREIESLSAIRIKNIMSGGERTSVTRKQVKEFSQDATTVVANYLESEEFRNNLTMKINDIVKVAYNELYTELVSFMQQNNMSIFFLPSISINKRYDFHFDGEADKINKVYRFGGRSKKDVCAIINGRKAMFIGYSENESKHSGKLQLSVIPQMNRFYMEEFNKSFDLWLEEITSLVKERKKEKSIHYNETVSDMKEELESLGHMEYTLGGIKGLFETINTNF